MEILYSGIFEFEPSPASARGTMSTCLLDIVRYDNGVCCVMITESKDKKGVSVTNVCDRIATEVYRTYLKGIPPAKIVWLEHSPACRTHKAHIDLLQFEHDAAIRESAAAGEVTMNEVVFTRPCWKRFLESQSIEQREFLTVYGYMLKELCDTNMVFAAEDKSRHYWRVWTTADGFFIVSDNAGAAIPKKLLDARGVIDALKKNQRFFGAGFDVEGQFTTALMKGFLNKGL